MKTDDVKVFLERSILASQEATSEANQIYPELIRQLISLATVFITATFFIFSDNNYLKCLNMNIFILIFFTILLFTLSIFAGIYQIFTTYKFFSNWSNFHTDVVIKINNKVLDINNLSEYVIQRNKKMKNTDSKMGLLIQIVFLVSGVFILTLTLGIIFKINIIC